MYSRPAASGTYPASGSTNPDPRSQPQQQSQPPQPPQQSQNTNNHWEGAFITCNQCLQPVSSCRNVLTPCLHVFCYQCAQQQFQINPGCPICRTQFDPSRDVRCISTTDNDVREYGRRLCTFSPRQLVEIFSYSLKFWSWQQQLAQKLKAQHTGNEQQLKELQYQRSELQRNNAELNSKNQQMELYIKQLEAQLDHVGGNNNQHGYVAGGSTGGGGAGRVGSRMMMQTPGPQPSYPQTPAAGYRGGGGTGGGSGVNAPFTPFAPSTRGNQQQQHHHQQGQTGGYPSISTSSTNLPAATPAVFGMLTYNNNKAESSGSNQPPQHTSYSNWAQTPRTPVSHQGQQQHQQHHQQHHQQPPPSQAQQQLEGLNSGHVLGERGRVAATRRANQG